MLSEIENEMRKGRPTELLARKKLSRDYVLPICRSSQLLLHHSFLIWATCEYLIIDVISFVATISDHPIIDVLF